MFSKIVTCLLLAGAIAFVSCAKINSQPSVAIQDKTETLKNVRLFPTGIDNAVNIDVIGGSGQTLLQGQLGISSPSGVGQATACTPEPGYDSCLEYGDYAKLQVSNEPDNCTRLVWTSTYARRLEDCYNLVDGVHWYGGGETYYHTWPIETQTRREFAHVTADSLWAGWEYGGVTENYWLVSTGVAITADEDQPLFISWGSVHPNQVCFVTKDVYPYHTRGDLTLKYNICTGTNVKDVHQKTLGKYYPVPPSGPPDATMLIRPFWSTWAQYFSDVNQERVLEYAQRIKSEGFELNSHIEIDHNWESCQGEAVFNTQKFPNVSGMIETLKSLDLKVTVWAHPFIDIDCPSFQTAMANGYFVKDQKGKPGLTPWFMGDIAGLIDFTNEEAVTWWKARLQLLQTTYGIDSFKFDAGESNFLPYSHQLNGDVNLQPNLFSTKYVEALASFGGMIEVRTGRRNQRESIFTRMLDKDSRWGHDNGLRSLIPTLLQFGIVGYPFVLPDMIGGNAYGGRPSSELFIRWLQANAFMPSFQFSLVPWDFGAQTVQLSKDILALREEYQDLIYKAVNEALVDGSPINRPMWWEDPEDPALLTIDSQYMLGGDIVVAPVVHEGQTGRDIYLPTGTWVAGTDGTTYTGPRLLQNYPASLTTLPYFIKSSTLASRSKKLGKN